jgi:hypothetical protein
MGDVTKMDPQELAKIFQSLIVARLNELQAS